MIRERRNHHRDSPAAEKRLGSALHVPIRDVLEPFLILVHTAFASVDNRRAEISLSSKFLGIQLQSFHRVRSCLLLPPIKRKKKEGFAQPCSTHVAPAAPVQRWGTRLISVEGERMAGEAERSSTINNCRPHTGSSLRRTDLPTASQDGINQAIAGTVATIRNHI